MSAKQTTNRHVWGAICSLGCAGLLGAIPSPAQAAGFTGSFGPPNLSVVQRNSNGLVDFSGVPDLVKILGSNNQSTQPGYVGFTATAPEAGQISFDWLFETVDMNPQADPLVYVPNAALNATGDSLVFSGVGNPFTQISGIDDRGPRQSGSGNFAVAANEMFAFLVRTSDNNFGAATATLSNFLFTPDSSIEEPPVGEQPGNGGESPGNGGESPGNGGEEPPVGEQPGNGGQVSVPEPAAVAGLLLVGLVGAGLRRGSQPQN